MFTLEDLDLTADLEYIREHAPEYLPSEVRPDGASGDGKTDPAADAVVHPYDYLIVR